MVKRQPTTTRDFLSRLARTRAAIKFKSSQRLRDSRLAASEPKNELRPNPRLVGKRDESRKKTYLRRVVVDVLNGNVHSSKRLPERIVHLAGLNLETERRVCQFLQINLANQKQFASLGVHLEETTFVAQYNAIPEPRVNARILIERRNRWLCSHLFPDSLALFEIQARYTKSKEYRSVSYHFFIMLENLLRDAGARWRHTHRNLSRLGDAGRIDLVREGRILIVGVCIMD